MDLTGQIGEAINAWFRGAAAELLGPALSTAGQILFETPQLVELPQVAQAWGLARDLANAAFVIAFAVVGVLVMAAGGYDGRYTAKLLVPRVALAALVANASLTICGALIQFDNALVTGMLGSHPGAAVLTSLAASTAGAGTAGQFVGVVVAIAAAALALLLIAVYIGRNLLLVVLACLAPLALATHALPQTDELARLWWRSFSGLVFVQVVQAALVTVALSLADASDWLTGSGLGSALLLVVILYLLFQLPFAAYRWALQLPAGQSGSLQALAAAVRTAGR